jgi:RimJ/RimL family protein N-acetyltransferase
MIEAASTDIGGEVFLRPMEEADYDERYLSWFRDGEVTHFLDARDLTRQDAVNYLRWGRETGRRFMYAICDSHTGLHIGNVKIGDIDPKSNISDLVTFIGDRRYWGRGRATAAIRLGIGLAFERYDIRKLSGGILAGNVGSLKAYTRAGFVVEAVLHSHRILEGKPVDWVVVSCFNRKYYPNLPSFPLPLPRTDA